MKIQLSFIVSSHHGELNSEDILTENSEKFLKLVGFALAALLGPAITQEEFTKWIIHLIEKEDEIPVWVFDVADMKDARDIKRTNVPIWPKPYSGLDDEGLAALTGIAWKRGFLKHPLEYDPVVSEKEALEALRQRPEVLENFKKEFYFVDL